MVKLKAQRVCPPGVFCMENMTLVAVVGIVILVVGTVIYMHRGNMSGNNGTVQSSNSSTFTNFVNWWKPNPQQLRPDPDVLLDPYAPPLRDDRYFMSRMAFLAPISGRVPAYAPPMPTLDPAALVANNPVQPASTVAFNVPINVPTQHPFGQDSTFRQIGILTRVNKNKNNVDDTLILPLMGRPLLTNRDKWNFYSMNDKNNMIKVPVKVKGKNGMNEYGVDNVYNNDVVYVQGYDDEFRATVYDNDTMRYLPFL